MSTIRRYLTVEALAFFAAALVHSGYLVPGYQHRAARIAETVLALALVAGLAVGLARPALARTAGLAAQGFALLGTLVGIFTMIVGVGPQSPPERHLPPGHGRALGLGPGGDRPGARGGAGEMSAGVLDGKVALVTGSSRGIGAGIARRFAGQRCAGGSSWERPGRPRPGARRDRPGRRPGDPGRG